MIEKNVFMVIKYRRRQLLCVCPRFKSCHPGGFLEATQILAVFRNNFVSPVVSPGGIKMGTLLITCDDRNNHSRRLNAADCAGLMTSAHSSKNGVFTF
jgi:hypothetical protein